MILALVAMASAAVCLLTVVSAFEKDPQTQTFPLASNASTDAVLRSEGGLRAFLSHLVDQRMMGVARRAQAKSPLSLTKSQSLVVSPSTSLINPG